MEHMEHDDETPRPDREATIAKIAACLASGEDPNSLPEREMVPRTTWFRWTSQAKGKPKAPAARAAMRIPGGRRAAGQAKAIITNVLAASAATNPKPIDLMARMTRVVDMIDQLERTARGHDGEIADPALFVEAIRLHLTSLTTIAKTSESLLSAQRLNVMMKTIFAAIYRASPEVQRDISKEFSKLEFRWGVATPTQPDQAH
jgi:hypothetical protein